MARAPKRGPGRCRKPRPARRRQTVEGKIDRDCQQTDEQAPLEDIGCIEAVQADDDRCPQCLGTGGRCDGSGTDIDRDRGPDPTDQDRKGQRQFDFPQPLATAHAQSPRRFEDLGGYRVDARQRSLHDRQQAVQRQRDQRGGQTEADKGNGDGEYGDGRDCLPHSHEVFEKRTKIPPRLPGNGERGEGSDGDRDQA
jgi:hypothetical protein